MALGGRASSVQRMACPSQIPRSDDLPGRRAVSGAADAPRRIEIPQFVLQVSVKFFDTASRLINQYHRTGVFRQELRGSHLILPRKPTLRVRRELNVVWRVG